MGPDRLRLERLGARTICYPSAMMRMLYTDSQLFFAQNNGSNKIVFHFSTNNNLKKDFPNHDQNLISK